MIPGPECLEQCHKCLWPKIKVCLIKCLKKWIMSWTSIRVSRKCLAGCRMCITIIRRCSTKCLVKWRMYQSVIGKCSKKCLVQWRMSQDIIREFQKMADGTKRPTRLWTKQKMSHNMANGTDIGTSTATFKPTLT